MPERDILLQKIQETQTVLRVAGPVHRRDLHRHLERLIRKLRLYDRTH